MRILNRAVSISALLAPLLVLNATAEDASKKDGYRDGPTSSYEKIEVEGWQVFVNKRLRGERAEIGDKAIRLLRIQLYQISEFMPAGQLKRLREVPIWLDDRPKATAQYHPAKGWLVENGYNPDKTKAVDVSRAAGFLRTANSQPMVLMHELAHAYHDRVLGFDEPRIVAAFEKAADSKNYESVLRISGSEVRHYALTNHKEYFAECTEAFFGTNDFYPFVRAELKRHDPTMYALLDEIWRGKPADRDSEPTSKLSWLEQLERSAQEGDLAAQLHLAVMYRDGTNVGRDDKEAVRWFRKAAKTKDPAALDHLGFMIMMGRGAKQDFAEARKLFEGAAEQKFPQGQFNLGRIFAEGLGVEQDYERASQWWRKAMAGGSANAAYALAVLHHHGFGVSADPRRCIDLCQLAAESGRGDARLLLGLIYHLGNGVPPDAAKARALWKLAGYPRPDGYLDMDGWLGLCRREQAKDRFAFVQLPHMQQGFNMCAPTAAAIAMARPQSTVDPYRVKKLCRGSATGDGTDWALLVEAIRQLERTAEIETFSNDPQGFERGLQFLVKRLDEGKATLVDIREPANKSGAAHTVVAVGYDAKQHTLFLHDPAINLPGIRAVEYDQFKQIWHSGGYTRSAKEVARPLIVID